MNRVFPSSVPPCMSSSGWVGGRSPPILGEILVATECLLDMTTLWSLAKLPGNRYPGFRQEWLCVVRGGGGMENSLGNFIGAMV